MSLASNKFDFSLTYYISGPMTGLTEFNYPAFDLAQQALTDTGVRTVSPHRLDFSPSVFDIALDPSSLKEPKPHSFYMKFCFPLLLEADGIIMLEGWPKSKGARAELDIAMDLDYPVYFYADWTLTNMNLVDNAL